MMNIGSTSSVTNSSNPTCVDQLQPTTQAKEAVSRPYSPTAERAVQAEAEAASKSSFTVGGGNTEPSPSVPAPPFQRSPQAWRSGEPYYPIEPINRDGDHWKNLYEKADKFDKEFCGGWNSEIDALLTFAGLFSAVVTAFAVESYKLLQPDPQDMTNRILLNLTAQLAGRNTTELPSFIPSSSSIRINTLWFLSLALSLTAGLVGILCKQWLRHYRQDISRPPKEELVVRQFRYDALLRCGVTNILGALPVLLGLGLILFFVGLIDFLQGLNAKVLIPVAILIGIVFAFLVITTAAPAFQYAAAIQHHSFGWYIDRPALFAFKSPQSLAVLHLVTSLFPLSVDLKVPNWTCLELKFFSDVSALRTYTGRALGWLDKTYSHSTNTARQICLCLQDIEDELTIKDVGEDGLWDFATERSSAAVIKSFFNTIWHPGDAQKGSHIRRDLISMRYLRPSATSFDQNFIVLESLIRVLNSSNHQISSLEPFEILFAQLSIRAHDHPTLVKQAQGISWQRAILFRNLLSEGRWKASTGIPTEVWNVSENLKIFTDEDLDSIFNALRAWIDQHSQDADLPTHCWVSLVSRLKPHELDEALRRPSVHSFLAFLGSRFQMGEGIRYLCRFWRCSEGTFISFFKTLHAWLEQNPQDAQSFVRCRAAFTTADSQPDLDRARTFHQPFRDFETFLEAQIARSNSDAAERGPVRDP